MRIGEGKCLQVEISANERRQVHIMMVNAYEWRLMSISEGK